MTSHQSWTERRRVRKTKQMRQGDMKGAIPRSRRRRATMTSHQSWTERRRVRKTKQMRQGDMKGPNDVIAAVLKAVIMAEGPTSGWCPAVMPETALDIG